MRELLHTIAEIREGEELDFTDEDIEALVRLDKPVIMVSKRR